MEMGGGTSTLQLCFLTSLEPFFADEPWTLALQGKNVLVIHPFDQSIEAQYRRRTKLFNRPILPDFNLITQRAVQTIAGNKDERFETWFDALEYMYNTAMRKEFDVAILGCGAYGFPLAAKLKRAGKVAIHLGGVTQLIFGIRGARWEQWPEYLDLMTEAWVRPLNSEAPNNSQSVEGGCYW